MKPPNWNIQNLQNPKGSVRFTNLAIYQDPKEARWLDSQWTIDLPLGMDELALTHQKPRTRRTNSMKILLIVAVSFFATVASAMDCEPRASTHYRMLCRGKITTQFFSQHLGLPDRGSFAIRPMTHMATGAGEKGELLIKGTCAFVDRPVQAHEPDVLRLVITEHSVYGALDLMTKCLADSDCALEMCVQNVGQHFAVASEAIQLNYPY